MAELNQIVSQIARDENFENFTIQVKSTTKKGDNYLAETAAITIKENQRTLELFCKTAETDEKVRIQMPVHEAYLREVFVYDHVLPFFVDFQKRYRIKHPFKSFAKKFLSSVEDKKEFVILENITFRGFSMEDRRTPMKEECIRLVFRELAKWHSLSFAVKEKEPDQFSQFSAKLYNFFDTEPIKSQWLKNLEQKLSMAMGIYENNPKIRDKLLDMKNNVGNIYDQLLDPQNRLVFTHGDPWCNNVMFKYELNKPTDVCLIDWQICKYDSPLSDLCYFFYLSASRKSLDNYKEFLDEYHTIIQENLESIGCNINETFPKSVLMDHWRLFCKAGFFVALSNLQIAMLDAVECQSFADLSRQSDGEHVMDILWKYVEPSEEYFRRLNDIVVFMDENDLL